MEHAITLNSGSRPLTVEIHEPSGASKGLVLVAYGSDGLTDDLSGPWKSMIRGHASSLAGQGFTAAGHGFIGTDRANQDARDLSKSRTLAFFQARP